MPQNGQVTAPQQVKPKAGKASVIAVGGTAVAIVVGPCQGGYVTNPTDASGQGIVTAENAYIDPVAAPGSTDDTTLGTTSILTPGQSYDIPALQAGVTLWANAATSAHKLTVVVY